MADRPEAGAADPPQGRAHAGSAAAARIVVSGHGAGWLLQPVDDDGLPRGTADAVPDLPALVAAVRALEASHAPRWVWESTAAIYPSLVRAGARVGRCHDLSRTESLLLAQEGRWEQWRAQVGSAVGSPVGNAAGGPANGPDDGPDDAADGVQQSLFEPPAFEPPARAAAEDVHPQHRGQLSRLSAAPGLRLLCATESAGTLAGVELGVAGMPWDCGVHDRILADLLGDRPTGPRRPALLQKLADQVALALEDPAVNPDSPADLLRSLRRAGLPVTSTGKWELDRHDHPAVPLLRRYKGLARLWTSHGWAWQETWVSAGRFRPEYVPAGVITGRWATRGGGALQIPKAVRGAVRAGPGRVLVVADAGQLEPRVLAAMSRDPGMVAATRAGDLYAELAAQALGRPDARAEAKLALLSAMYGGGAGSPALAALRRRFPGALALLERAARTGEDGGSVRSVLGRVCPPAQADWLDGVPDAVAATRTRSRGRFTRNFVVQASAADWAAALVAGLRTRLAGLPPRHGWQAQLVFFQHDEVIIEAPAEQSADAVTAVAEAGAEATRLVLGDTGVQVPLTAVPVASYADKS